MPATKTAKQTTVDLEAHRKPGWPHFEVTMRRPGPGASIIDELRWGLAWSHLTDRGLAIATGIDADRIRNFIDGRCPDLTLAEAAKLAQVVELRLLDAFLPDEYGVAWRIAKPMIQAVGGSYREALRLARGVARGSSPGRRPACRVIGRQARA